MLTLGVGLALLNQLVQCIQVGSGTRFQNIGAKSAALCSHLALREHDMYLTLSILTSADGFDRVIAECNFFPCSLVNGIVDRVYRPVAFGNRHNWLRVLAVNDYLGGWSCLIAIRNIDRLQAEGLRCIDQLLFQKRKDILVRDFFFLSARSLNLAKAALTSSSEMS